MPSFSVSVSIPGTTRATVLALHMNATLAPRRAAAFIRGFAKRHGVSPLAVDWSVTKEGVKV